MYMNKNKRNLIIASAVLNLISTLSNLILSIIFIFDDAVKITFGDYTYLLGYSSNIVMTILSFIVGTIGSVFLLYSVRNKGKYFRTTQGLYVAGLIIIIIVGSFLSWLLLFISMFIPDIIIINSKDELKKEIREEEKAERKKEQAYDLKVKRIEELKRMRDEGLISEEEYKEKLFEIL